MRNYFLLLKDKCTILFVSDPISNCFVHYTLAIGLKKIYSPGDCQIRAVIRLLNIRNVYPLGIYLQICEVYRGHKMCEHMERNCVTSLKILNTEKLWHLISTKKHGLLTSG